MENLEGSPIEVVLSYWVEKLSKLTGDCHLLCPKVSNEDDENYSDLNDLGPAMTLEVKKERIAQWKERQRIVYWNSIVFGMDRSQYREAQDHYSARLHAALECELCIVNWHMGRKAHLQEFGERYNEEAVQSMEFVLQRFDFRRLDKSFEWAIQRIEKEEETKETFKLSALDPEDMSNILTPTYEALCCMSYLAVPEKRKIFQQVFSRISGGRKPLRLGNAVLLPAMTAFLFGEDPIRLRFARAAWQGIPPNSVGTEQFEWAVNESLCSALDAIKNLDPNHADLIPRAVEFWDAMRLVIRALKPDIVANRIPSLDAKPSLYDSLFGHLQFGSGEILLAILQVLADLLEKSGVSFWTALGDPRPFSVAEQVFNNHAFLETLNRTEELSGYQIDSVDVPPIFSWIQPLMRTLRRDQKTDAAQRFLHMLIGKYFLDPTLSDGGQNACMQAAMDTLQDALSTYYSSEAKNSGFKSTSGHNLVQINESINNVVEYQRVIVDWIEKPNASLGSLEATVRALRSSLELDAFITMEECKSLRINEKLQQMVSRRSPELWEGFLELAVPEKLSTATQMLHATLPFLTVEEFRPPRKAPDSLDTTKVQFNAQLTATSVAIGKLIQRLCECSPQDLVNLSQDASLRIIFTHTLHGMPDIHQSASQLVQSITGEDTRSDAIVKLVQTRTSTIIRAFNVAIVTSIKSPSVDSNHQVSYTPPWGIMSRILVTARDVITGLFDLSVGVLRQKTLARNELDTIMSWWVNQWRWIEVVFNATADWSQMISLDIMTDFCRGVIELAESLSSQDGLLATVVEGVYYANAPVVADSSLNTDNHKRAMIRVLGPCSSFLMGLVRMIRLRDEYLVDTTVKIICKQLRRLREFGLPIEGDVSVYLDKACRLSREGRYEIGTKLTGQQKAELLRSLGRDEEEEDVVVISIQDKLDKKKPMKQSTIDAWSKSGPSSISTKSRSNADDVASLSSTLESKKSVLEQILARQAAKAKPASLSKPAAPSSSKVGENEILARQAEIRAKRQREKEEKAKRNAEAIAKAQALRESGLSSLKNQAGKGLGDGAGKGSSKSDMMVDSDDSDDSEDSDDDGVADLIKQTKAGTLSLQEAERRRQERALRNKVVGPVKKQKIQRSAKDVRARLVPPMESLHASILAWDIFHEGNDPPEGVKLTKVSNTYENPVKYKETFMPLLIFEAWRSFVTAKDECTAKPFGIKILTRMSVDRFLEVTASVPMSTNRENRFLADGDIAVISEAEDPLSEPNKAHCLARIWRVVPKKEFLEVTWRINNNHRGTILQSLTPGQELHAIRITNMTTIEREYAALESLRYYDLMTEILNAAPSPILKYGDEAMRNCIKTWQLNPAQARAVLGAKDNDGFTLIQGPPGTGKTKTIVAMVGALLTGLLPPPQAAASTSVHNTVTSHGNASALSISGLNRGKPAPPQPAIATKKLLICAPSNAAVDELVLRIKKGIVTANGTVQKVPVIRLGRSEAVNSAVKDVMLDELVKARLEESTLRSDIRNERENAHAEAGKIKEQLAEIRPKLDAARHTNRDEYMRLQRQFDELKSSQMKLGAKIDAGKESGATLARELELRRRTIQQQILDSAVIICATLSGSGHDMFRNLNVEFETVIIDEAAQCVELSALIPLKYGCSKCILVGDPKQLPPTVLSQSAQRYGYDQSLFVRMQQNHPKDVYMLDCQYRMHPSISAFPSCEFYGGLLADGDNMAQLRRQPWHETTLLSPYRFFDVKGSQKQGSRGQSLVNIQELDVAMQLFERLRTDYPTYDWKGKIGIITPYKAQLFELQNRFTNRFGAGIKDIVEFNTTDAFQGRECEIIIFSCVRASPTGGIGFMTDIRRMNVGLTRARSSLWILGDSRALVQGEYWSRLIEDSQKRNVYTSGNISSLLQRPIPKLPREELEKLPSYPPSSTSTTTTTSTPTTSTVVTSSSSSPTSNTAVPAKDVNHSSTSTSTNSKTNNNSTIVVPVPSLGLGLSSHKAAAISGVDERGEIRYSAGQTSTSNRAPGASIKPTNSTSNGSSRNLPNPKKRTASESSGNRPDVKRVAAPPTGPRIFRQTLPGKRPIPKPKPPTDPSAMQVLGLAPPERPPSGNSSNSSGTNQDSHGTTSSTSQPPPPNRPAAHPQSRKRPAPSPFISSRKPGRRP